MIERGGKGYDGSYPDQESWRFRASLQRTHVAFQRCLHLKLHELAKNRRQPFSYAIFVLGFSEFIVPALKQEPISSTRHKAQG